MTEHIANVLTEHMFADGLIECGDNEETDNKYRNITSKTGNDGIAVLTLESNLPSPNDLPTSIGSYAYIRNGPFMFRDYYDLDAIVISAYGQVIFSDGVYHLMRSDYISS